MKKKRHEKIVEFIEKFDIETQEELARRLKEAGFNVTQTTISRDIRELKLSKVPVKGKKQKYSIVEKQRQPMEEAYIRVLKEGVVSMEMAQNILVIKTVPGMAMAAATALDAIQLEEIAGCIAGDDTIMCAVRTMDDTNRMIEKLEKLMEQR
ncbi:arginine repressor [bacterium 1XD42-8]|jgi:transcriptional regulator of arginine metabolism|nr:arginine repressor [Lachnospiraceae bacterium]RKJ36351.1 arginine repressor [bacterium 1XD42-8]